MISYDFLELMVPCCDICMLKKVADGDIELTLAEADLLILYKRISSREVLANPAIEGETQQGGESSDKDQASRNTKRSCGPGSHRKERLEACQNVLMNWRRKTWQTDCKDCIWGPNVLLPEGRDTRVDLG
jgi:hypothetical protein